MECNKSFKTALEKVKEEINSLFKEKESVIIAIDGRCGSGKTTLAKALSEEFDCNVFHIDDFYVPREMQTEERLSQAGGNIDRKRFLNEVLLPAKKGEAVSYKAFDCETQSYKQSIEITPQKVTVIEGSYSCHSDFFDLYDLHIFLTVSPETQKERIIKRNSEVGYKDFENKWIPFEERYFKEQDVKSKCEIVFEMG